MKRFLGETPVGTPPQFIVERFYDGTVLLKTTDLLVARLRADKEASARGKARVTTWFNGRMTESVVYEKSGSAYAEEVAR